MATELRLNEAQAAADADTKRLVMRQANCVLPYLTLAFRGQSGDGSRVPGSFAFLVFSMTRGVGSNGELLSAEQMKGRRHDVVQRPPHQTKPFIWRDPLFPPAPLLV